MSEVLAVAAPPPNNSTLTTGERATWNDLVGRLADDPYFESVHYGELSAEQPEARPTHKQTHALGELAALQEVWTSEDVQERVGCAFNVSHDPYFRDVRAKAKLQAEAIVEYHMQHLRNGEFDHVPLEADPGGTARKLVAVGKAFGKESAEYKEVLQGLRRDCERRIAEASRMKGWELYDETVMTLDANTGQFFSDGLSVDQMLENGLTPAVNPDCPEELPRRINEFVELKTDAQLVQTAGMEDYGTFVLSQCPQSVRDAYLQDPNKAVASDYVPEIDKTMIRHKLFDPKTGEIRMRQLGVPGLYFTNEVVNDALARLGVTQEGDSPLDRTQIHGTQFIAANNVIGDAVSMLRLLDQVASEHHGFTIYLGMPLEAGQHVDYEGIPAQAEQRRKDQAELTEKYTQLLIGLEESGLPRELVAKEANDFVRNELIEVAKQDPSQAKLMFNDSTVKDCEERAEHIQHGRYAEAAALDLKIAKEAPAAGGCGAGSCGLEDLTASEEKAVNDLLGVKAGEDTVKDNERPCMKCGQLSVVYAWSSSGVKKGCLSCHSTEGVSNKKPAESNITIKRPKNGEVVQIKGKEVTPVPAPKSQSTTTAA